MNNHLPNPAPTPSMRVTFNLRRDERGYYWETTAGQAMEVRFADPDAAFAAFIAQWSSGAALDN